MSSGPPPRPLGGWLPGAAVTDGHTPWGLKEQKCVLAALEASVEIRAPTGLVCPLLRVALQDTAPWLWGPPHAL